jgi:hypothetical protein
LQLSKRLFDYCQLKKENQTKTAINSNSQISSLPDNVSLFFAAAARKIVSYVTFNHRLKTARLGSSVQQFWTTW